MTDAKVIVSDCLRFLLPILSHSYALYTFRRVERVLSALTQVPRFISQMMSLPRPSVYSNESVNDWLSQEQLSQIT